MKRILLYIWLLLLPTTIRAAGECVGETSNDRLEADSLAVSLLTCSPGTESYALYGHTALRVRNLQTHEDFTFNYGIFSFDTPGFVWRFVLGQTDYTIGVMATDPFIGSYLAQGRSVTDQCLDLRPDEVERLLLALARDANTPGWTYRYNFLGDNCTSRAVRMVVEATGGRLVLPEEKGPATTFRDIIHACSLEQSPWNAFGQDLMLGADVDTALTTEAELAFPLRAEALLEQARIRRPDGSEAKLVSATHTLLGNKETDSMPTLRADQVITPTLVAFVVLLIALAVSRRKMAGRKRAAVFFDYAAMAVQGAAGCIIFVLFFFSEHPAVGSNWLIGFLNPLPLLWLPVKAWRETHKRRDVYVSHVQPVLLVALAAAALAQKIPVALAVLALSLLVRSGGEWWLLRKNGAHHINI